MKIEDTWNSLSEESQKIDHSEVLQSMKNKKMDVLAKLQKKQVIKMMFTIFFTIGYTTLLFFVKDLIVIILFGIILTAHVAALIYFIKEYRGMQKLIPMDGNIRETLSSYLSRIKRVIRIEERAGLLLYPVAVSAGFFFALLMDKTFEEVMRERTVWVVWIVTMVAFTPIGHWAAKKLNRIAFQKQLTKLEDMISQIDEQNQQEITES